MIAINYSTDMVMARPEGMQSK